MLSKLQIHLSLQSSRGRTSILTLWLTALSLSLGSLCGVKTSVAQLYQADGSLIPTTNNLHNILNRAPLNEGIDVINDASLVPEVFTPTNTLTFSFVAEGGGYENAFGWYNLGDDVTDPNNRFIIFNCYVEPQTPYVTQVVNFCGNPQWKGGAIGFFLITPERVTGGTRSPNCALNDQVGYVYYSEPRLNTNEDPNNRFVHHLVYRSNTFPNAFYFGFEDLFRGGDNDFEDALILVEGLLVGAAPEACDLFDDDCDGRVDEGADVSCETVCGRGVRICEAGSLSECTAPDPEAESCDGVDNDCDGAIDEAVTRACDVGCGPGVEVCLAGSWSACTAPTPRPESCNNVDEDCDGLVDEGLERTCANGCGVAGVETCSAGSFGRCDAPDPLPEECDGADNDCDGRVDEEVSQVCVNACGVGVETCATGQFIGCDAPTPSEESCDGVDNDCDGAVDETLRRACVGACGSFGEETCLGGAWLGCTATQPRPELCNLLDDDCDGEIDEALQRDCESACGAGTQLCEQGAWSACDAPIPQIETCDGVDQDCDGRADEGVSRACRAECGVGAQLCLNGSFLACNVPPPQAEVCDGLDNDCDGVADEGLERACDSLCGEGTELCVEGLWVDCSSPTPRPETCNALDDDCDGSIDEALTRVCDNPCGEGMSTCERGRWSECPATSAEPESCDGQDNDCDGQSDESATCPSPDDQCIRGECVYPCSSGECPVGSRCLEGFCFLEPCQTCRAFEVCEQERCVDPCAQVSCEAGTFCRSGECLSGECSPGGCDPGKICREGACVPDECDLVTCGASEACDAGRCFATCVDVTCAAGEHCVRGLCVESACAGVECPEGERCLEGACSPDSCAEIDCSLSQRCVEGRCVDDPCRGVVCPQESRCVITPDGAPDCARTSPVSEPAGGESAGETGEAPALQGGAETTIDFSGEESTPAGEQQRPSFAPPESVGGCDARGRSTQSALWGLALLLASLTFRSRRGSTKGARESSRRLGLSRVLSLTLTIWALSSLGGCEEGGVQTRPTATLDQGSSPFTINGCTPLLEVCNGEDDDCDGVIDNVDSLSSDPQNCGGCGQACEYAQGEPRCLNGVCQLARCEPGFVNADGVSANGCEEACQVNPQVEAGVDLCNQVDDDCDGIVDEGFNLGRDLDNCGVCGRSCLAQGVEEASCISGRCVIGACASGQLNLDGDPLNGCEYACAAAGGLEECNGVDDDCDGRVDEDLTPTISCVTEGLCAGARAECRGEDGFVCTYPEGVDLTRELRCDGRDDDCDGSIDEEFFGLGEPCDGEDADLCLSGVYTCSPDRETVICRERLNYEERCDGVDNDCDEQVDEGFLLLLDPQNCGACGQSCDVLNGTGSCRDGVCFLEGCDPGFIDLDGELASGCEYQCARDESLGEPVRERCDGQDDDCDGRVDEEVIIPPEARCLTLGVCAGTDPQCQGEEGFRCVYLDSYEAGGEQSCDGLDNDCDGLVDEDFAGLGELCDGADDDLCPGGVWRCADAGGSGGPRVVCTDDLESQAERCDGVDNDCDESIDEDFNLSDDPNHCGRCGLSCDRESASTRCEAGRCVITACGLNRYDLNGLEIDGCEYQCIQDNEGVELCNGLDDDCDGRIDEEVSPPLELSCGAQGVCAGIEPTCLGVEGFSCELPRAVYQEVETRCDQLDNDCDGLIDEAGDNPALADLGALCSRGVGACLRQGVYLCAPDQAVAVCSAVEGAVGVEVCNGIDDDCDGDVDEEIARADEMAQITTPSGQIWIDRWEASRPDATGDRVGINVDHACSKPGVLPWNNLTLAEARQACLARGKRLCTDREWFSACDDLFPYGPTYDAQACSTDRDAPQLTGIEPACTTSGGVFDLSGNLAEWTECAQPTDCQIVNPQLGGSYADRVIELWRCDFRGNAVPTSATATGGFRCCADL